MTTPSPQPDQQPSKPDSMLARVRDGYRSLTGLQRYALLFVAGMIGTLLALALGIALALRLIVFPHIDRYKGDVERLASKAIGNQVEIARIGASWDGINPRLDLDEVVLRDQEGRAALSLPAVAAVFSWRSLSAGELRLASLELSRPDLDIRRETDGKLVVAGIVIDLQKKTDTKTADWVLRQEQIVIREGRVRWTDHLRDAPELSLEQVEFSLQNRWRHHRFRLTAIPPSALASPIEVNADFTHPFFSERISDVSRWKGDLFVDLQNTDLAAWKRYIDYPFDIQRGQGAVRAWLNFDRAMVADFTADVKLSGVALRLEKNLPLLELTRVSGRISAREDFDASDEDDNLPFGDRAHAIQLIDFAFQTEDGLTMPETTISESFVPGTRRAPGKTEVSARLIDLSTLSRLAQYLPLSKDLHTMLTDFSPSGQLSDFSVKWQGSYPELVSYDVSGNFAGLSIKGQPPRPARPKEGKRPAQPALPGIPGFENITGHVTASERGGAFTLDSANAKLQLPGYFSEAAVPFEQLRMQANWKIDKDQILFQVDGMDFVQEGIAGSVSGRHIKPLAQQGKPAGTIDMKAYVKEIDVQRIGRYLPLQTPQGLRQWLAGALEKGHARDIEIRVQGDLEQFPFRRDKTGGKPKGEFSVSAKIDNGKLNYTPGQFARNGKAPLWPQAENIQGTFKIDNDRIEIHADSAMTAGVALSNVDAVIPDMMSNDLQLDITGHADGALQDFVRYTNVTPVAGWIGNLTENTTAIGKARLLLKMQLMLDRLRESKVQGTLQFMDNDVNLLRDLPTLHNAKGSLEFWEKGFKLNDIGAQFLGGATTISGGTQQGGKFQVRATGGVTPEGLLSAYPYASMQRLTERMSGSTRFAVEVNENGDMPDVIVESTLRGLAVNFPAPLGKNANQSLPLRFHLSSLPSPSRSIERDEMRISIGNAITARYLRQKDDSRADWRVTHGVIGVNVPNASAKEGLALNINLHSLDLDEWQKALEAFSGEPGAGKSSTAADQAGAFNMAQYISPALFTAVTDELTAMGARINNARISATILAEGWQAQVRSDTVTGHLAWQGSATNKGTSKLTARLNSLTIPVSLVSGATSSLGTQRENPTIPALDVTADDFVLFGKPLGRLELAASNTPAIVGHEWRIDRLNISNPDASLKASGNWLTSRTGAQATSLKYTLDIANAGKLLERLGFANVLRRGKGKMEGNVSWNGLPFSIDYPSLSGSIVLNMESGQFLQAEPGAGRLLGVLSLQSLPRRLALDFRDVFSQGFAFDGITATAAVSNGVLQTDNLKMRGVNATVLMDGAVDIAKETQNLHIVVLPEINAGAASVVYGLAINPAIGLGTFLAQLFLRDPLMRAFTYEYQVTGSWAEPNVKRLPRSTGYPKEAPEQ